MKTNPLKELAKLPPNQQAKIRKDLIVAKSTSVYQIKGFKKGHFNIKDIFMYNPTKHIALIQTKSSKEYLLIKKVVYIDKVGYGVLDGEPEKTRASAMKHYWELSESTLETKI